MSMQYLFGSDSEGNSDDGEKKDTGLPSTQVQMDELFGGESNDNDSDKELDNRPTESRDKGYDSKESSSDSSSSEEESGGGKVKKGPSALNAAPVERFNENSHSSGDDDNDVEMTRPKQTISDISDDNEDENGNQPQDHQSTMQVDEESFMPTTQDLFGEELDVSSDEEEKQEQKDLPVEDSDDLTQDESDDQKLSQDTEHPPTPDREEEEPEEEGLSIAIELPKCNISLGKELYFIKLPNFLSVDTKPFDSNFYEDEVDEDEILDEEGRARLKLKVENTIRWRYSKDKDGSEIKESNCRFVRWSDGSISMHLGNEIFDVFKMTVQGDQNHLFVQQGTGLQAQAVFKNKLSFRPHSTASQTHRKMTMSIADRMQKAQKIKMMPAMERDPENQRSTLLKKEEERLRVQTRRENQQRRMRERTQTKGLSSSYLDQDMDDEEDFEHSIAAIKNSYKSDVKGGKKLRNVYDSDESNEGEEKLRSAKLDIDSDDDDDADINDDEEIRQKREELSKKKKTSRKVIDESDDECD